MTIEKTDHAEANATGWLESIREMVAVYECDYERLEELRDERDRLTEEEYRDWPQSGELSELEEACIVNGFACKSQDEARERIEESPLSVEVRGGWHTPGAEDDGPVEYCILLSTGGPALRIVGDLNQWNEPASVRLQHQDWFTPWTEQNVTGTDHAALLTFAGCFYFGEG